MSLGLTPSEMNKLFDKLCLETLERRQKKEMSDISIDLMIQGIPVIDAQLEAKNQVILYSVIQALLLVIDANNFQVETQLSQRRSWLCRVFSKKHHA